MMTSASVSVPWLVIGAVVGLAGLALLAWALHGDRAKGRRRCPKCWYELGAGQGLRCPECGREAKSERQLGRPRRRRRLAVLGFVVLIAGAGVALWPSARAYDWNRVKPVWWLVREGKVNAPSGDAARAELLRRVPIGGLSDEWIDEIAAFVIEMQGDASITWGAYEASWAEVVEAAWDAGELDAEQIEGYARGVFDVPSDLVMRSRVRAGTPVPMMLRLGPPRDSRKRSDPSDVLSSTFRAVRAFVDGARVVVPPQARESTVGTVAYEATPSTDRPFPSGPDLVPGVHTLSWEIECVVHRGEIGLRPNDEPFSVDADTLVARWTRQCEGTVEVVEGPTVTHVDDDALRQRIDSGVRPIMLATRPVPGSARTRVDCTFDLRPLTIALCADVIVRTADGEETHLGTLNANANEFLAWLGTVTESDLSSVTTADVVLRANPELSERTVEVTEIWSGEIVFEGVEVDRR